MSCLLPLPYIRPCGTKCFAGGLLHFRGPGFEAEDLQEPHLQHGHGWPCFTFYVQSSGKERFTVPPRRALADHRPIPLDAKRGQMFWLNRRFLAKVPCYAPSVLHLGEEAPRSKTSCGKRQTS